MQPLTKICQNDISVSVYEIFIIDCNESYQITTFCVAIDENFVNMTKFPFQCTGFNRRCNEWLILDR